MMISVNVHANGIWIMDIKLEMTKWMNLSVNRSNFNVA